MSKNRFTQSTTYKPYKRHISELSSYKKSDDAYGCEETMESSSKHTTCSTKAFGRATVNVPVAVKPFSIAGPAKTSCCGEPVLKDIRWQQYPSHNKRSDHHRGCDSDKIHNHDKCHDEICYFVFSQEICVEIPIHFGATAHTGDSWVECHEAFTPASYQQR